ncbi:MAG: DUF1934 domain-containing protein [Oscillospiraceae bacterium]
MKKDVIITIKGLQNYEEQDKDSVELVTAGRFYLKEGNYYITYKESELTGLGSTTTTLKIEDERVTILRSGETRSHMVFEEGQKHVSYYDTVAGALTVGISTRKIKKKITEHGGRLMIDYAVEINNSVTGENAFDIGVREVTPTISQ